MGRTMDKSAKIFVAGHRGLVGSATVERLQDKGFHNVVTATREELDLAEQRDVRRFFEAERPDYVILAAAKVGGIWANSNFPADFIRDNLLIATNVTECCHRYGVQKLVALGSSCIYPRMAPQPISEDALLTGPLEPTNEPYAIAKIAGLRMAQAYRRQYGMNAICLMPTNLYGPRDNFDPKTSHVLPAMLRRFHEAKVDGASEVVVWGTGTPRREFLHVNDLADAVIFLMEHYDEPDIVNIGWGKDLTIRELAETIADVVGFKGDLVFDTTKPDGTPRKLLDTGKLQGLGWSPSIGLREGIESTYKWYVENVVPAEARPV